MCYSVTLCQKEKKISKSWPKRKKVCQEIVKKEKKVVRKKSKSFQKVVKKLQKVVKKLSKKYFLGLRQTALLSAEGKKVHSGGNDISRIRNGLTLLLQLAIFRPCQRRD
jgi:valyl-tRNA synthetase